MITNGALPRGRPLMTTDFVTFLVNRYALSPDHWVEALTLSSHYPYCPHNRHRRYLLPVVGSPFGYRRGRESWMSPALNSPISYPTWPIIIPRQCSVVVVSNQNFRFPGAVLLTSICYRALQDTSHMSIVRPFLVRMWQYSSSVGDSSTRHHRIECFCPFT